jgi:spore coat polysaccharide biosynthesis protein SpsF (cytidylyltransferase family)
MTGIFIIARLGSTRLSEKHLITVAGKTFIEWLVLRMLSEFKYERDKDQLKVFITTSVRPPNKKFEEILADLPVSVFYGSDSNIPLRQLQCAIENNIDHIISIDGDDILCSSIAARSVMEELKKGHSIAKTAGLPLGMNVMGYNKSFLQQALDAHYNDYKLETGWGRIFIEDEVEVISYVEYDQQDQLRFTLDYKEDADFFTRIINDLSERIVSIDDTTLINYVIDNQIFKINSSLNGEYWTNFERQKQNENNKQDGV